MNSKIIILSILLLATFTLAQTHVEIKPNQPNPAPVEHQEKIRKVLEEIKVETLKKNEQNNEKSNKVTIPIENPKDDKGKQSPKEPADGLKPKEDKLDLPNFTFEDFFNDKVSTFALFGDIFNTERKYRPESQVYSSDTHITIVMELPGVKKEDIKVEFIRDKFEKLIVSGKREKMNFEGKLIDGEFNSGNFESVWKLSNTNGNVNASMKDGILILKIEKKPIERKTFEIKIE